MASVLPPVSDVRPFAIFIALLLAFNMIAGLFLPLWGTAMYGAWLAVGLSVVVKAGVEPGLPRTLTGNIRRILRSHVWPLYAN